VPLKMPYGKINGMRLTLDKSGRVVLQSRFGSAWDLGPGRHWKWRKRPVACCCALSAQQPSMVEHSGFLVHTGQVTSPGDWQRFLEDLEQERLHDILVNTKE